MKRKKMKKDFAGVDLLDVYYTYRRGPEIKCSFDNSQVGTVNYVCSASTENIDQLVSDLYIFLMWPISSFPPAPNPPINYYIRIL